MGIYTLFCKFKEKILANENYEKFLRVNEQRISLKRVIAAWNLCWIPLESTTQNMGESPGIPPAYRWKKPGVEKSGSMQMTGK